MSDPSPFAGLSVRRTFIVVYVTLVSIAHEYGYWSSFHINFLEHVGLADLPKLAVWPIGATAGASIVWSIVAFTTFRPIFPPGGGVNTRAGIFLNKIRMPVGLALFVWGVLSFSLMKESYLWWVFGPALIANGLVIAVDLVAICARLGANLPVYGDFFIVFLPCLAFGVGNYDASNIINGRNYVEARFKDSGPFPLRYLGRASDYVFFWNADAKETEIRQLEAIQPLFLQHKKPAPSNPASAPKVTPSQSHK
jgi:hypothetical protein